ncbi:MAG: tetratricopeptide repeat protein [Polyangiaceae bacterium]
MRAARPDGEPSWQALARAGKFDKAFNLVESSGFAAECDRATGEELALLADTARLSSRPQQAIQALTALRRRFPGSPRAGVAAFNIARVHFDQRGAYDEAARWFRTYLREQPSGPLVREAQGRLMEALYRAGDRDGAVKLAEQYLASNPNGPHARVARTLLGR